MKTALVTGASGALGRVLVARLRSDPELRVVEAGRTGDGVSSVQLDVAHGEQFAPVMRQHALDVVFHLAATFADDFQHAYTINVDAARHLLEAVQSAGTPVRVILVGSAAEYGVVRPDENPIREDRYLAPVTTYGMTKAWQTHLATVYAARGVDVVTARVFNLEGPGISERLFIGRLRRQIDDVRSGSRNVIELGPLTAIRDYVSIDEAADQLLAIAAGADAGSVHHVASGVPVAMRDILVRYLERAQLDPAIVRSDAGLSNRKGYDVPAIYADITRTARLVKRWRGGSDD